MLCRLWFYFFYFMYNKKTLKLNKIIESVLMLLLFLLGGHRNYVGILRNILQFDINFDRRYFCVVCVHNNFNEIIMENKIAFIKIIKYEIALKCNVFSSIESERERERYILCASLSRADFDLRM